MYRSWFIGFLFSVNCMTYAETPAPDTGSLAQLHTCLQSTVIGADEKMTVGELKKACQLLNEQKASNGDLESTLITEQRSEHEISASGRILKDRLTMEALNRSNRFILTPHKRNYFLPISYNDHPNSAPYINASEEKYLTDLSHAEAEMQLSIKILLHEDIFGNNGHLYLGYTNHAFWQLYNDNDSAPFRETDHQPELILTFTNDWEIAGFRNAMNEIAINHQSNGQGGLLSRSWNRVMLNTVFERGNFVFALSPWYRLPEPEQKYPGDPDGDDNPDISDYMGNFEFNGAYEHGDDIFSVMLRNNLKSQNRGALELGWSFPLSSNLRGNLKYFNGYGHSLIDYQADMEVLALGVIFTDLF